MHKVTKQNGDGQQVLPDRYLHIFTFMHPDISSSNSRYSKMSFVGGTNTFKKTQFTFDIDEAFRLVRLVGCIFTTIGGN